MSESALKWLGENWLALIGAVGTVINLLLWWQQRIQHKAERKERVTATLRMEEHATVSVYNAGRIPVYIKKVALHYRVGTQVHERFFNRPIVHKALPSGPTDRPNEIYQNNGYLCYDTPIPVGDEQRFMLFHLEAGELDQLLILRHQVMWISVYSAAGELYRISGKTVLPVLKQLPETSKVNQPG